MRNVVCLWSYQACDGFLGCWCRVSLLGVAAWRQNPVFLPYPAGRHGIRRGVIVGLLATATGREHVSGRLVFRPVEEAWGFVRTPAGVVWPVASDKLDVY